MGPQGAQVLDGQDWCIPEGFCCSTFSADFWFPVRKRVCVCSCPLTDVNLWWSACSGQQRLSSLTLVAMQMKRSKFAPNYIRYSFRMPPALVFRTSAVSIRNTNSSNFSVFPSCASIQQLLTLDTEGFPSQSWHTII